MTPISSLTNNFLLAFISTLPVTLIAEANVLRERFASQQRHRVEENNGAHIADRPAQQSDGQPVLSRGRRQRNGKMVSFTLCPLHLAFIFCSYVEFAPYSESSQIEMKVYGWNPC
jgi:hypothetical protein